MHAKFFLAAISKRFGSAGLHDLIVEARLSGPESVNQILNGKEYNYGIRICKAIFENLQLAKLESEAFTELIKKRESTI